MQVDPTTDEPRAVGRPPELGIAEVAHGPTALRVGHARAGSVEGPHVEVLDAVLAVEEVERSALAERDGDDAVRQRPVAGEPGEEVLAVLAGDPPRRRRSSRSIGTGERGVRT